MRFKYLIAVLTVLWLGASVPGLEAAARKSTGAASKSPAKKPAAKKPAPRTTKVTSKRSRKPASRRSASRRRVTQQAPSPERYQRIQQALAAQGYYHGPIDGKWTAECVDALKRFQQAQSLTANGKLGSLSLIALGLGPKREAANAGSAPQRLQP
ncbi:MAG: peptidoglycan-binding protein [Acidobacteria bacterium]|nr:peptidoglycan-binding protein [Acidobacteriota bacterium]